MKLSHHVVTALLAATLASTGAHAQIVTAKGVGTVQFSGKPTPADKEKAYKAAQVASIERYMAENGEAEAENFDAIKDKVEANLDRFLLNTTVLNEQEQTAVSRYSMSVKTEINLAKLRITLRSGSEAGKAAPGSKSSMVFVFVAREPSAVKSFDARVVKREDIEVKGKVNVSKSQQGREGESISSSSIGTSASVKTNGSIDASRSMSVTTGGSSLQKADEISYRVLSMANYKTAVTSVFSQSGFTVNDPDFVLSDANIKSVNQDYSHGNDLAPATMRSIVQTLKAARVPLMVLGTFDMGGSSADPVTGNPRVAVTVTARVLDLQGPLPREVASVPAVQYFAVGTDSTVASTKALKDASMAASKEIVARLNVLGVH